MTKAFVKKTVIDFGSVKVIHSDDLNYTVEVLTETDKGNVWKHKGWFSTIPMALNAIHNKGYLIDNDKINSLETFLVEYRAAHKEIKTALEALGYVSSE